MEILSNIVRYFPTGNELQMFLMESGGMNGAVGSTLEICGAPLLSVVEEEDSVQGLSVQKLAHFCFFTFEYLQHYGGSSVCCSHFTPPL